MDAIVQSRDRMQLQQFNDPLFFDRNAAEGAASKEEGSDVLLIGLVGRIAGR